MKRVYILRSNEEDGRLMDALLAEGPVTDDGPSNPSCPRCGSPTMLVYPVDDDLAILSDRVGDDPEEDVESDEWFLTCQNANCSYEEAVERVQNPAGAILFDAETTMMELDETYSLYSGILPGMEALVEALEERVKHSLARNIKALLDEARWRADAMVTDAQEWLAGLSSKDRILFDQDGTETEARVMAVTEEGALLQTDGGAMLVAPLRALTRGQVQLKHEKPDFSNVDPDSLLDCSGFHQCVVVQGQILELRDVDRLGQFHVGCRSAETAQLLHLRRVTDGYWEGIFLRRAIECRYDARERVRVKGYWLSLNGRTMQRRLPWVSTTDPEAAAAIGLKKMPDWSGNPDAAPRYAGTVTWEEVEEQGEERTYYWPLPATPENPTGLES